MLVKLAFRNARSLRPLGKVRRKKTLLLVEDQLSVHLNKLDINKSVEPSSMHPEMLRELSDVIVRPLWIIFERS